MPEKKARKAAKNGRRQHILVYQGFVASARVETSVKRLMKLLLEY